jgi:hypothetical protein
MSPILAAAIVVFVACCDALRDRWVNRTAEWWPWHIVKWLAFYPPLIALTVLFIPWMWWPFLTGVSWILWRIIYRFNMKT